MRTTLFVMTLLVLTLSSCYYGAMQGARTLGEDHMNLTSGVTLPAYLSTEDKREAEESRIDYLEVYPTFSFAVGATERIDLGVSVFGYGVGPSIKYGFLDPESRNAVSALLDVNYVVTAQVMMPRLSLCGGRLFGDGLEVFLGGDVGYGPDLANIPKTSDGSNDWDMMDNTLFSCVRAGCRYEIKGPDSPNRDRAYLPEAVMFQFSVPLDLNRGMILVGLGIAY